MRTDVVVGSTRWTPDGTQPPKPLPVFDDPLAGLVTGALPGSAMVGDTYDEVVVKVPKPVEVDREGAQAMLKAVMSEEDEPPPTGRPVKLPPPAKVIGLAPGMLPEPERRSARQRVKQAMGSSGEGRSRPNSSVGGVIVALILLAIFGFIAIQVVVSIVESISGIVD